MLWLELNCLAVSDAPDSLTQLRAAGVEGTEVMSISAKMQFACQKSSTMPLWDQLTAIV